jgi:hypothetical protein
MDYRTLGRTGLTVSRLGAGLSEIGYQLSLDQADEASRVLNRALDGGITFLDTSACYGYSESFIGRSIAHRRDEYVLATKAGHVTGDYEGEAWTGRTITDSIERSLRRMKTDRLDLVQLHSCDVDVLERGEVIEALLAARDAGKTRFVGYSGDNEAALWAVESGHFDTLQTSFNFVDQQARWRLLDAAKAGNMGVIVKRPIANGVWGSESSPSAYADPYFDRYRALMAEGPIPGAPSGRVELALGYTLSHEQVDVAIVGTRNPRHMVSNLALMADGPHLSAQVIAELERRFDALGADWRQLQ